MFSAALAAVIIAGLPFVALAQQSRDDDAPRRSRSTVRKPAHEREVDDDDDDRGAAARAPARSAVHAPASPAPRSAPYASPASPGEAPAAPADAEDRAGAPGGDVEPARAPTPPAPARDRDDDDDRPAGPVAAVVVTARRLDAARESIEPGLGASVYTLTNDAVEARPGGETTSLAQVLLQVPGVTQDASGQLRVRSQGDLQYRINNVIVPEGLTDLGESLSARLVDRVDLITGALPAQYGLHAAGVVAITTKSGILDPGGQAELYGGSHGAFEPAFELGSSRGGTNVFASGSYRRSNVGLNPTTPAANPAHDRTDQVEGFADLDRILDSETRLSLILGASDERFQLPPIPSLQTAPSGRQEQAGVYALMSLLRTTEAFTLQASAFARGSRLKDVADPVSVDVSRSAGQTAVTAGLQIEGLYRLNQAHTVRAGLVLSAERGRDRSRLELSGAPPGAFARSRDTRETVSAFVQDQWRPFEPLVINGGLRLDRVTGMGGGDQASPRLSAVLTPRAGLAIHAGYARYFVPAPQEETVLSATATDAGLRAETDDYFDIGAQQKLGGLTLGVDAYLREARNLIDDAPVGLGSLRRAFNYARGRTRGVEFSLTYAKGPFSAWSNLAVARAEGLRIVAGGANLPSGVLDYAKARYVPLTRDQAVIGSAGASYRLGPVRLSGDVLYGSGARRTEPGGPPNAATLPGYVQLDVAAVLRLGGLRGRPLDLRLDVLNALDETRRLSDGTALGGGLPRWRPRRGIFVGLEQAF